MSYRADLGPGGFGGGADGIQPGPPVRGLALSSGDRISFRKEDPFFGLAFPDTPLTLRVEWNFRWFESVTGLPGVWVRVEKEVTAFFRVEPIEGSDCVFARTEQ
jgi:hypothetical protein